VQPLFEKARPAHSYSDAADYLRPFKRALPDLFVTKEQLPRALDLANDLYRALTSRGHRVVLAADDGHHYTRPFLAYEGKKRNTWERTPLLGGTDALQRFRTWEAPAERLHEEDVALLNAEEGEPEDEILPMNLTAPKSTTRGPLTPLPLHAERAATPPPDAHATRRAPP
jgi:hypothetical protein